MYSVLIVDDKEPFRRKISRLPYFQEKKDCLSILFSAQNGQEGLKILEENDIDIVITDIRMPIMDGLSLLREIRARELCPCTILLSEYSEFAYAREGIVYGAFDYVVKPVTSENLVPVLDRAIVYLDQAKQEDNDPTALIQRIAHKIVENADEWTDSFDLLCQDLQTRFPAVDDRLRRLRQYQEDIYHLAIEQKPEMEPFVVWNPSVDSIKSTSSNFCSSAKAELQNLQHELHQFAFQTESSLIKNVCQYVLLHVEESIDLSTIAGEHFVNKKYVSGLFRKETGLRFVEFVSQVKMQRAKVLLSAPDAKIYLVAEHLGYSDAEYFSKVFKSVNGYPPSRYLEKQKD